MSRRLVAVTAAVLALAGCSSSPGTGSSPSGTSAASGSSVEAWAEKVCSGVADEFAELKQDPSIDGSDPVAAKASLGAFLDKLDSAMDTIQSTFRGAGAPPVDNGDKLLADFDSRIDEIKTTIGEAKTELEATSTTDPAAFQQGFTKVGEKLQAIGSQKSPLEGLNGNAEVAKALQSTPTCKSIGSDPSSSSEPTS